MRRPQRQRDLTQSSWARPGAEPSSRRPASLGGRPGQSGKLRNLPLVETTTNRRGRQPRGEGESEERPGPAAHLTLTEAASPHATEPRHRRARPVTGTPVATPLSWGRDGLHTQPSHDPNRRSGRSPDRRGSVGLSLRRARRGGAQSPAGSSFGASVGLHTRWAT